MSIKLSELAPASALIGDELVEVIQNGRSRRSTVSAVQSAAPAFVASFVTVSANPELTNERVLTQGAGILITDNGPGNSVVIALDPTAVQPESLYSGGVIQMTADVDTLKLFTDINTATPPVAEAVTGAYEVWDAAGDDLLGQLGYAASNALVLRNRMHGGSLELRGENAAGADTALLVADPDGALALYVAGVARVDVQTLGELRLQSDGNTDAEPRLLVFTHSDGTSRGYVGHFSGADFLIKNEIHGGEVTIQAESGVGTIYTLFEGQPSGDTYIRSGQGGHVYLTYGTTIAVETTSSQQGVRLHAFGEYTVQTVARANGGLSIINEITSGRTGTLERVLSLSDFESGQPRLLYRYSTGTAATDPGAGFFKIDNVDYSLATNLYCDDNSDNLLDAERVLGKLAAGDHIFVGETTDPTQMTVFKVTGAATDNTGWWTVPVTYVSGSTAGLGTTSGAKIIFDVFWGSLASGGGAASYSGQFAVPYGFVTSTATSDPGAGNFGLNNADYSSVNNLQISDLGLDSVDGSLIMDNIAVGDQIYIADAADSTKYVIYEVQFTPVDNTGWWRIPVFYVAGVTTGFTISDTYVVEPFFLSQVPNYADPAGTELITGAWTFDNSISNVKFNPNVAIFLQNQSNTGQSTISQFDGYLQISCSGAEFGASHFRISDSGYIYTRTPPVLIKEDSAAVADVASYGQLWVRDLTPNWLAFTDDGGNDYYQPKRQFKVKQADETLNNSSAYQDDQHLVSFALVENKYYRVELLLRVTVGATPDLKLDLVFSNATQLGHKVTYTINAATIAETQITAIETEEIVAGDAGEQLIKIEGFFQANATTGGTLKLQWAQNAATAEDTTVHEGSTMLVEEIFTT